MRVFENLDMITKSSLLGVVLVLSVGCSTGTKHHLDPAQDIPYPLASKPESEEIHHVATGLEMNFEDAMNIISSAQLVCIGETHDNVHAHRVESQVIKELERRFPGQIAIGMEMFRTPQQGVLDQWINGELTEAEFIEATDWLESWGFDFAYYRAILEFARDHQIDVVALNISRTLQEEVRKTPIDKLSKEVREKLPEIVDADPHQRAVMRAVYGGHLPSPGMFDSFFRIQMLWEETMASRIVEYLRSKRGDGKKMVTISGGWHVRYGFGIPKKVNRRLPLPYIILEIEENEIPPDKQDQMMNIELPEIPLLPADFIWYVPYESLEN